MELLLLLAVPVLSPLFVIHFSFHHSLLLLSIFRVCSWYTIPAWQLVKTTHAHVVRNLITLLSKWDINLENRGSTMRSTLGTAYSAFLSSTHLQCFWLYFLVNILTNTILTVRSAKGYFSIGIEQSSINARVEGPKDIADTNPKFFTNGK